MKTNVTLRAELEAIEKLLDNLHVTWATLQRKTRKRYLLVTLPAFGFFGALGLAAET